MGISSGWPADLSEYFIPTPSFFVRVVLAMANWFLLRPQYVDSQIFLISCARDPDGVRKSRAKRGGRCLRQRTVRHRIPYRDRIVPRRHRLERIAGQT